ncbi:MAG: histidinol-phosphate transaminase [Candidatus Thorarchaeota archaeon]
MNSYLTRRIAQMQNVEPYSTQSKYNLASNRDDILYLDSNENLQISSAFLRTILNHALSATDPRMYSSSQYRSLILNLSDYLGIQEDEIVIGSGADGLIDLITGSVMTANDTAVIVEPTFSMYRNLLSVHRRKYREVRLLEDFSLDIEKVRESLKGTDEVLFLCSPNNPTGNQFTRDDVKTLLESTEGLLLLDEAYVEFASETLVDLVKDFENLFVLRTFSKAFGLAGLRIGYAVTNDNLARILNEKVSLPYPVSTLASAVASILLENIKQIEATIEIVKKTRERLAKELEKMSGVSVYPSQGNFFLLELPLSAEIIAQKLLDLGVKVRIIDWIREGSNFIRVTIPPFEEFERVVGIFKEVLSK